MEIYYELNIEDDDFIHTAKDGLQRDYDLHYRIQKHKKDIGWNDGIYSFTFFIKPEFGSFLMVGDEVDLNFMADNSPVNPVLIENLPIVPNESDWCSESVKRGDFWKSFDFHEIAFVITKRRMRFTDNHCIVELQGKFCHIE